MSGTLPAAWFIPELKPDAWLALLTERFRSHEPQIRPMAFYRQAVGWTFALPLAGGTQALVWLTPEPPRVRLDVWTDGWPERAEVDYGMYATLLQRVGDYLLDQVFEPDDPGARLVIGPDDRVPAGRPGGMT